MRKRLFRSKQRGLQLFFASFNIFIGALKKIEFANIKKR